MATLTWAGGAADRVMAEARRNAERIARETDALLLEVRAAGDALSDADVAWLDRLLLAEETGDQAFLEPAPAVGAPELLTLLAGPGPRGTGSL